MQVLGLLPSGSVHLMSSSCPDITLAYLTIVVMCASLMKKGFGVSLLLGAGLRSEVIVKRQAGLCARWHGSEVIKHPVMKQHVPLLPSPAGREGD